MANQDQNRNRSSDMDEQTQPDIRAERNTSSTGGENTSQIDSELERETE